VTSSARDKAERCFALARSTTFPAERATAINRGTRIAQAAHLDLDTFDIPGRIKRSAGRQPAFEFERVAGGYAVHLGEVELSSEELGAALARFADALRDSGFFR
jgi:hypothetical protein